MPARLVRCNDAVTHKESSIFKYSPADMFKPTGSLDKLY